MNDLESSEENFPFDDQSHSGESDYSNVIWQEGIAMGM